MSESTAEEVEVETTEDEVQLSRPLLDLAAPVAGEDLEEPPVAPEAPAPRHEVPAREGGLAVNGLSPFGAELNARVPDYMPRFPLQLTAIPQGLRCPVEQGHFLWDDLEGAPMPHVRRSEGRQPVLWVNSGKVPDLVRWMASGAPLGFEDDDHEEAVATLVAWLSARPGIVRTVRDVELARPAAVPFDAGFWCRLNLRGIADSERDEVRPDLRRTFHGTSFACLHRILSRGVRTGFSLNTDQGRELRGIWSLAPAQVRLLTSYTLYSCLNRTGWLFGPILELRSPQVDPRGRPSVMKRGSGSSDRRQCLSYDDSTTQVCAWVHIVHIAQLAAAAPGAWAIHAEGRIPPELEIDATSTDEEILRLSRDAAGE